MLSCHLGRALLRSTVLDQRRVLGTLLLDIGILQDRKFVLQSFVALGGRRRIDADGHIELKDGKKSYG